MKSEATTIKPPLVCPANRRPDPQKPLVLSRKLVEAKAAPGSPALAISTWSWLPAPTHHSDSVSDGFSRQVAAELGSDHPAVPVGSGHLPPDHAGLVGFTAWRHRVPAQREHRFSPQGLQPPFKGTNI